MPTYLVETIFRPGVMYEVSAEEYDRLVAGNWLVGDPDRITPEVLDQELASLVEDADSLTGSAIQATLASDATLVAAAQSATRTLIPTPVPTVEPTVGRPLTVFDNNTYNGLGGIARDPDGTLVAVWRSGADHDVTPGTIRKAVSRDGGLTWGENNNILGIAEVDLRDPCPIVTADGTWVVLYFTYDVNANAPTGVYTIRSTNQGTTWAGPYPVANPFSTSVRACSMRPVQLDDGTIVAALYGQDSGSTYYSARLVRSTDDGLTWTAGALAADGPAAGRSYQEPTLARLSDGRLLCLLRTDSLKTTKTYSTDDGLTWGPVTDAIPDSNGRPEAYESAAGALVCIYRTLDAVGGQAAYRVSLDGGATWSVERLLASSYGSSQYASICETSRGVLGVLLATEGTTSAVSRVHFRYMIVAPQASPIGDQGAHGARLTVAARLAGLRVFDTLNRADRANIGGDFTDSGHEYVPYGGVTQILGGEIAYVSGFTALAAALARGFTDGRLRASLKWTGTSTGLGVLFRLLDSSNYLYVGIEGGGSTVRLYKVDGGTHTTLLNNTAAPAMRGGYWHEIEVSFKGDRIKVFADGEKAIDFTLSAADQTKYGVAYRHGFRTSHASHRVGPWSLSA